jgi:hypothetical protein
MTVLTETFKLTDDSALTTGTSGYLDLSHKTDESDNPQTFTKYLGSLGSAGANTADRKIQADSDPGVDNVTITPTYILPKWTISTAYTIGTCVEPTTANGFRYRCTSNGTSHATTEPIWPTGLGSSIADGTTTWTNVSAKHDVTEVTLALTSGALATNTPGAALALGTTITSGTGNAKSIWIKVENHVNTVSNNFSTPELGLESKR